MFLISMQHIQYDKQLKLRVIFSIWYVNKISFTVKYFEVQHNKKI